jgi:hypothetical protein
MSGSSLRVGLEVRSFDGVPLGTVGAIRAEGFLLRRGQLGEIWLEDAIIYVVRDDYVQVIFNAVGLNRYLR